MKSIISYFIKFPLAVNLIMVFVFLFGTFSLLNIQHNFFPNVPKRDVYVDILFPGASPEEVEEGAILKIEENLKGLEGLERITSVSSENMGKVTVEMKKGTNMNDALMRVKNAVGRIASFPKAIETVVTYKHDDTNIGMWFVLTEKGEHQTDLKQLKQQARKIEHDLLQLEGVSKIKIGGYPPEEIAILINEDKLNKYNLTFAEVARVVSSTNLIMTGGSIKDGEEEFYIRVRNKAYDADAIGDMILRTGDTGGAIRLRDVAEIKDQFADTPSAGRYNGKAGIMFTIRCTFTEDVVVASQKINAYLKEYNEEHQYFQAIILKDMSVILNQRIDLLKDNGLMGIILVLLFLSLFLNPRIAFWVAVGIPFSMLGMFIILPFTSVTMNMLSLFALILVLGILVDDAIVVAENIYRHWQMGKTPVKAAIEGTLEVTPAVVSGVLTTVLSFLAFLFLEGRTGDFFSEVAIIVGFILMVSLVEGLLVLPSHLAHSKSLKPQKKKSFWQKNMSWAERGILHFAKHYYRPFLKWAINHRAIILASFTALFIISIGAIQSRIVRPTFFPEVEGEDFTVSLEMPSGTQDIATLRSIDKIENGIWCVNEQLQKEGIEDKSIIREVSDNFNGRGSSATVRVQLVESELRHSTCDEVIQRIRNYVGDIPGAETLLYEAFVPFGKAVVISLQGDNNKDLQKAKEEIKVEMKKREDISDVSDNAPIGNREIEIDLKPKAYQLGVSYRDIIAQVRAAFWGYEAQRIQRGKDEIKVWVKYDLDNRRSIGQLEQMKIRLANGKYYPLCELATLKVVNGVSSIRHLDFKKEIQINASLSNSNISVPDLLASLKKDIIMPILKKYPDVKVSFDGQSRQTRKMANSAKKTLPVILLLMFAIVVLTLRSVTQSLLVYAIIPLAFVGIVWGHFIHGMPISLMSVMGMIALVGVMINDSLVLINALNINLKDGMKYREALLDAGQSRLRPIILTTLTTVVGVAPMVLETSMQARFLVPVAISLAYGMLMATTTTLILLPVVLVIVNNMKTKTLSFFKGRKLTNEEVEPALKQIDYEED